MRGNLNLSNDTFANNTATGGMGADASASQNKAAGAGGNAAGAVYVEPTSTVTASNLIFSNNTATAGAGGAAATGYPVGSNGTADLISNSASVRNAAIQPTPPANNAPCYCTGTGILIWRDGVEIEVAVETLAIGDLVVTAAGTHRPIRWIGSRSYPGLSAPQHDCPVRIKAGAFADGVPARDLLVSPDHALIIDGLFVAAGHLVNGISITRGEAVADLTYWHVELDSHDLLMAENTPAESFLAAPGVRCGFDGVQALDAGAAPIPYAPRTELGRELAALRGRLAHRAVSSDEAADLGPIRAWLDRCLVGADGLLHVGGWAQDTAQPDAPVCLDVMVDGAVVAFAVASEYRADLAAAGVGDGRVGFDLGLDVRLASGVSHVIEVRRSADGALVCAKQIDSVGVWTALLAA
ncbi:hypothetical protein FOHLNKBM_4347 [Methylobacterium longum]|nr:hypothetical protein FOHLNKBM_4347 [Methylobacterium longum]